MKPQVVDTAAGHVTAMAPFGGTPTTVGDNNATYLQGEQAKADAVRGKTESAEKVANARLGHQAYNKISADYQKTLQEIEKNSEFLGDSNQKFLAKRGATVDYMQKMGIPSDIANIPWNEQDHLFQESLHAKAIGKQFGQKEKEKAAEFYRKVARPTLVKEYNSAYKRIVEGKI